jgi:hypothetical protein
LRAINTRGVISNVVEPSASGSFRMFVPSGTYFLVGGAGDGHGKAFGTISQPLRARAGTPVGMTVQLAATNLSTGRVVVRGNANIPEGDIQIAPAALLGTIGPAADRLAAAGCHGRLP